MAAASALLDCSVSMQVVLRRGSGKHSGETGTWIEGSANGTKEVGTWKAWSVLEMIHRVR
jgi:hypothetical protein